jgi:cob(I)alamin adenosyltransferase
MKIYTKTGDDGTTGLFGGGRISKDAVRLESYGTVDELNSILGIARCYNADREMDSMLHRIQNDLFNLGADLATPMSVKSRSVVRIRSTETRVLEDWIDRMEAGLPVLANFILPGGTATAAHLQLARSVCRRAERLVVKLSREEKMNKTVIVYLNRLSDLLFVLARWENHRVGQEEIKWMKKGKSK